MTIRDQGPASADDSASQESEPRRPVLVTAEGLRERVAAAIEARVKASVLPERPPYDGSIGLTHFVGASFHDLADVAVAALAVSETSQQPTPGEPAPEVRPAPENAANKLAAHRDVMVASVQEAAIYLDVWGAELTALQAGAVVDALVDAVRKAEDAPETPGDAETEDRS